MNTVRAFAHLTFEYQLMAQEMFCPKYDEMLANMITDPPIELLEFNQQNAELFAYLTTHAGKVN